MLLGFLVGRGSTFPPTQWESPAVLPVGASGSKAREDGKEVGASRELSPDRKLQTLLPLLGEFIPLSWRLQLPPDPSVSQELGTRAEGLGTAARARFVPDLPQKFAVL